METLSPETMKYLSAAICTLPMAAVALGIAKFWSTLLENVGRNPQANKELSGYSMIGFATIEAIGLFSLGVACAILFM